MDWLAANWPVLMALMGLAAAWGRAINQVTDLQNKQTLHAAEMSKLRDADASRREKLQAELESIRIVLTEIKTQLGLK